MGALVRAPLPPVLSETLRISRASVGPLRSTGITPLRCYCGPIRHPLAVPPLPIAGYRAELAPPLSRWGEEGFSSRSTCPLRGAETHPPPARAAASAGCSRPYGLRRSNDRDGVWD